MLTPKEVMEKIVAVLDEKKAGDIKVLMTRDVTVLADYFVICTATGTTHAKSLSDEVEFRLKQDGEPALRTEGYSGGTWILVDFGCVVVHIFTEEGRKFYNLEHLWQDAAVTDISALIKE